MFKKPFLKKGIPSCCLLQVTSYGTQFTELDIIFN